MSTIVNGGMEGVYDDESGGGGGTIDIAPDWGMNGLLTNGTDEASKETTIVHSGSASQKIDSSRNNGGILVDTNSFYAGIQYKVVVWLYATLGSVRITDTNANCINEAVTPGAAFTMYSWVITAGGTSRLKIMSIGAALYYVDDVSVDEYYDAGAGARILNLMPMRRKRRVL